jgi:superfamily II DNA or RNA helicase
MHLKPFISSINSWSDFKNVLNNKTKLGKGNAFEELVKYYLQYKPVYKSKLKNVWLFKEVPTAVLKKLNLPSNDQGIDIIAETHEKEYWAIQCKYLQDEDQKLSHRKISTFISLSTGIATNIKYCLVCTTVDEYANLYVGKENIGFCKSDEWNTLDKTFFDWVRNKLSGKEIKLKPYKPKPHQAKALKQAEKYFLTENNNRGKLVFPCGAGKSLTGYWFAQKFNAQRTIVAVPSLSLIKQTLEVYLRETVANNETVEWLCVCSDEGIGKNDDIAIHTQDIGIPSVTNKDALVNWLVKHKNKKTIIFTTYQSGKTIADASKIAKIRFDLGILDEAHKTVGVKDRLFSYLLFDKNISIDRRIFMTATERRYAGSSDTILSMDDEDVYGETFATMTFKEAIDTEVLSDYKIITLFITDTEVKELIQKNKFVKTTGKSWNTETEARTLASLIALRKAMDKYPIKHAVTFHSSIAKAKSFQEIQPVFSEVYPSYSSVESFHVTGAMPTAKRSKIVEEFAQSEKAIITNAKCLTEGVDVPNIDCVLFADPRKSTIDIVQAVGRALRRKEGKEFGYVIIPVFTKSKTKESIIDSDEFSEVLTTLRALASNDERIIEYFRDISQGKQINRNETPITFDIDVKLASLINENELINSLQLTVWNKLAKLSWRPFEDAREFVHSLNLKNVLSWNEYCDSGLKPIDIPRIAERTYKNKGWKSWGDWLGTGNVSVLLKQYRKFEEAKVFIQSLNLKSNKDWRQFIKTPEKPNDIPSNPESVYKNSGWTSWGDWLGTEKVANRLRKYRPFEEARKFVHALNLKGKNDWSVYSKSGLKPDEIPTNPPLIYKDYGWTSWGDWLGTGFVSYSSRQYRPFEDARKFVHTLNFIQINDWRVYCKSGKKPNDIPSRPDIAYKKFGWISYGNWLGTENIATYFREYRPFEEARKFVHTLNFRNRDEWSKYCKSGLKPVDIPVMPHKTYKNLGWKSMGDWLGTGTIAPRLRKFKSFKDARQFVHSLKLKNSNEWSQYCKSGLIPADIPTTPSRTYKNSGWLSLGDWLGTGKIADINKIFRPFVEARRYVHKLNLKSWNEWRQYYKSGIKPDDIPTSPDKTYRDKGWVSWNDWLGKK